MNMSTATVNRQPTHPTDTWTQIPGGMLPCASCGIAVPAKPVDNSFVEVLFVYGRARSGGYEPPHHELPVTRCETCSMIRSTAAGLLAGHSDVRQRIGAREIAEHRLECALAALDAVGITDAARIDRLTTTSRDIVRLLDALTIPGGHARWASHAVASGYARAPGTPASFARWAHVSAEQKQELRDATAGLLARRVETPVDVLAPSDDGKSSGCLLCGVSAVQALRADAASVWTLMSADSVGIGGRPRPDDLDGVVCPRCDTAIDAAHGIGMTAMRASVRAALNIPGHLRAFDEIHGLIGWAALPAGTPPNEKPWDHIDLSEIHEQARAILGIQSLASKRQGSNQACQ